MPKPEAHTEHDQRWMRLALDLAQQTIGLATPNPRVGCVLVKDGVEIGRGAHLYDDRHHAEVVALRQAASSVSGATAYVTLEPCSHTGRTPPCARALIEAGIGRVVVATGDPNPQVNGRGMQLLLEAGISVTVGVLSAEARSLNDGFARFIRSGMPFVTLKAGLSLDGRIAPAAALRQPGSVAYLTGAHSLLQVQAMRHSADAILTGIGTVLADNPLLTDRSNRQRRKPLLRVVLDSQLRLPLDCRLVQTALAEPLHPTLLLCTAEPLPGDPPSPPYHARRRALEAAGIPIATVARTNTGALDLGAILRLLAAQYQILNILAEGGSQLTRSLLTAPEDPAGAGPIADKLCLFYAPLFLGDAGVPLLAGPQPISLAMRQTAIAASGSDLRFEAYLRDPWHGI